MGKKERKAQALVWDRDGIWYWQLNGSNGRVLAMCPQTGYSSKRNAENAVQAVTHALKTEFFSFAYPNARRERRAALQESAAA